MLLEKQRNRLPLLQLLAETRWDHERPQDRRAVERPLRIGQCTFTDADFRQRIQPLDEGARAAAAIQIDDMCRRPEYQILAEGAIHQGEQDDRQGQPESQLAPVHQHAPHFKICEQPGPHQPGEKFPHTESRSVRPVSSRKTCSSVTSFGSPIVAFNSGGLPSAIKRP